MLNKEKREKEKERKKSLSNIARLLSQSRFLYFQIPEARIESFFFDPLLYLVPFLFQPDASLPL